MRNFSLVLIAFVVFIASPGWSEETERALVGKIVEINKKTDTITILPVGEDDSKTLTFPESAHWSKDLKMGSIIRVWGNESNDLFTAKKVDVLKVPGRFLHDSTGVRRRLGRGSESGRGGPGGHGRH